MKQKTMLLLAAAVLQVLCTGEALAADPLLDSTRDKSEELRAQARGEGAGKKSEDFRYWGEKTGGAPAATGLDSVDRAVQSNSYAQGVNAGVEKDVGSTTVGAAVTAGRGDAANRDLKPENYTYQGVTVYQRAKDAASGTAIDMSASYVSGNAQGGEAAGKTDVYSVGTQVSTKVYDGFVKVEPFVGAAVNRVERSGRAAASSGTTAELPLGVQVTGRATSAAGFAVTPRASVSAAPVMGDEALTKGQDMRYRSGVGVTARKDDFSLDLDAQKDKGAAARSDTTVMLRAKQRF